MAISWRGDFHFADRFAAGRTLMPVQQHSVWRPQGMAGWILNATVAGSGSLGDGRGGVRHRCRVGDLLLFAPTAVHDYHAADRDEGWIHLWAFFYPREHWQAWLRWEPLGPGILHLRPDPTTWQTIVPLFEQLVATIIAGQALAVDLGMCLLEQILILCRRTVHDGGAPLDPRIAHAVEWLAAHHARRLGLADIAAACGMSTSRFSHAFRDQVGVAPMRFLERLRIDRAREQLVMTGRPIAEIAQAVGFEDPDWFARVFRRHTGTSPRAFRRRAEAEA